MSADTKLFAYGSLVFEEVWWHVLGRAHAAAPATLRGHLAYTVAGRSFPGLVRANPEDQVSGVLYSGLDATDWQRLDAFEDSFYQRLPVTVALAGAPPTEVSAYIVPDESRSVLSATLWDPQWFETEALAEFLDRICGFDPDIP